jgi:hypothetical protein
MIEIKSFYPFLNWSRVTQEFYEDKAIVKWRSLTIEHEFEFEYKDVVEITNSVGSDGSQNSFGFRTIILTPFGLGLLSFWGATHSILLQLLQTFYLCGLVLYITSFKKSWLKFYDKNDNRLITIKQTSQNRELVPQIIEMIKTKSNDLKEISATDPFPEKPAAFELARYDISELATTTERFYENEIIGFQKDLFQESVYRISYDRLSPKVFRGKKSLQIEGWALTCWMLFNSSLVGIYFALGLRVEKHFLLIAWYIFLAVQGAFIISLPFNLIKRNTIGLYDKNGHVAYWTFSDKKNKDKIERIIEFIQSKIPTEEKA